MSIPTKPLPNQDTLGFANPSPPPNFHACVYCAMQEKPITGSSCRRVVVGM